MDGGIGKGKRETTIVVDVIFTFGNVGCERGASDLRRFTHGTKAFG